MPPNIMDRVTRITPTDLAVIQDGLEEAARWRVAEEALQNKWNALNGAPGPQNLPGANGLVGENGRYFRNYNNGTIYIDNNNPLYVMGAILDKYRELGGPGSWLGWPTSEESDYSQGGRFVTFEHGTIYWSPQTGSVAKEGALLSVIGDISARYRELGGPASWLGWPETNELDFVDGGKVSKFEHGCIYWWPDTGAIDLNQVVLRYRGLYCFGETDNDGQSTADEPYVVFSIIPAPQAGEPSTFRTNFEEDVDHGDSRPNMIDVYRGPPHGVAVTVTLMEHDLSDPDMYRDGINGAAVAAASAASAAITAIPGVGIVLGPLSGAAFAKWREDIVDFFNGIIGGEDDNLGSHGMNFTPKDLIRFTKAPHLEFWGIQYHVETPLYDSDGATYKVYFDVVGA